MIGVMGTELILLDSDRAVLVSLDPDTSDAYELWGVSPCNAALRRKNTLFANACIVLSSSAGKHPAH